jgi:hypothetical protein
LGAWNRTLVYFGVADPDEADFSPRGSPLKIAASRLAGAAIGAVIAGTLFGLVERDVVSGALFGALWLVLMLLLSAWTRRRAKRSG